MSRYNNTVRATNRFTPPDPAYFAENNITPPTGPELCPTCGLMFCFCEVGMGEQEQDDSHAALCRNIMAQASSCLLISPPGAGGNSGSEAFDEENEMDIEEIERDAYGTGRCCMNDLCLCDWLEEDIPSPPPSPPHRSPTPPPPYRSPTPPPPYATLTPPPPYSPRPLHPGVHLEDIAVPLREIISYSPTPPPPTWTPRQSVIRRIETNGDGVQTTYIVYV